MTNKEISILLRQVAASYVIKDEKKFRFQIIAYQNAADAIENLSTPIEELISGNRARVVPGVGPTIQSRLEELFKTGGVKHFDEVMAGVPKPVFIFMQIPSIGAKKAFKLASQFNLENPETAIDELEKIAKDGKIADLPGFGEKSQADILRAINEFREGKGKTTKMLLPYAYDVAEQVMDYLKKSEYVKNVQTLGSLRRMKTLVGDIDIAVISDDPDKALEHFTKYPRTDRIIEKGTTTSSLLTTGGNQVDLMVLSPSQWGSLLQHFTGSKEHNVALREFALKKGLSLSEKGIKDIKTGKMHEYKTEEEFYKAIGLDYVPPEMRENTGEIELAIKHKLPSIIELKDVKGDFHIHSGFPIEPSHDLGRNSISEMLQKAKQLGYEYLGFSEHNPSVSKHTKQEIVDLVRKRNEELELQNELHGVKTFKLMETDILPNGSLALPDEALELLDATIVSIHSVFKMGKEEMTKRAIKGLSHPKAKILAHPTGRLLNERYGYDLDFDELFRFCQENNKALEINAYPNRLDLYDEIIRRAIEAGVKLTIDTDSHAAYQMELMPYGVAQARRGWATKDDIINAMSYNKVREFFNS